MWISYLMRKLFCCCWKTRCKPDRKSVVKPVPVYTKNNFKYWPIWKWFWTNCLRKPQQTSPNVRSHIWQKATNQSSTPCDDGFTTTECLKKKKTTTSTYCGTCSITIYHTVPPVSWYISYCQIYADSQPYGPQTVVHNLLPSLFLLFQQQSLWESQQQLYKRPFNPNRMTISC